MHIVISGGWGPTEYSGGGPEWRGEATAAVAVCGLALIDGPDGIAWSRMGRGSLSAIPLRVAFRRGVEPGHYTVGLGVGSHRVRQGGGVANLHHAYRGDEGAPRFDAPMVGETGKPIWLGAVAGEPALRLGVLLIAEAETRTARTGLWHLRAGVTVPSPIWTRCLDRGRSGLIRPDDRPAD